MSKLAKALTAAAGNAGEKSVYVDDVFSTYLYEGTGSALTITNGIDLDGEGGLVWLKGRSGGTRHSWFDTARGVNKYLMSNNTDGETTVSDQLTNFNSDGFTLGSDASTGVNGSGTDYVSWTFRKQAGFFDVVTVTAPSSGTLQVSHDLGTTVGCIILKSTSNTDNWVVYHRSQGANGYGLLNSTGSWTNSPSSFDGVTDTYFTLYTGLNCTAGRTYVAYLFAHDGQSFGDNADESIIKCGSFTASTGTEVDLGFEPQWIIAKSATSSTDWYMFDTMRGWGADRGSNDAWLYSNSYIAEFNNTNSLGLTPTGFIAFNGGGETYIYIAIRRPMKTPTEGTEVFTPYLPTVYEDPYWKSSFPVVDFVLGRWNTNSSGNMLALDRLRGSGTGLETNTTDNETTVKADGTNYIDYMVFDRMYGFHSTITFSPSTPDLALMFKRATGFMDVVAYTGTGASTRTLNHNLGVIPELIIFKRRTNNTNTDAEWKVWSGNNTTDSTYFLVLDKDQAEEQQNNGLDVVSSLSSTEFTVRNAMDGTAKGQLNRSTEDYISYLFATLAGVSKVGSYTGTGSNVDVDCGFSAGARFILIKRTDSTGDWYVWDSERGIVAGNDPYLLLNSTAAEVTSTDYIDPLSSGFTVTSSAPAALNASGGEYIFLAIA